MVIVKCYFNLTTYHGWLDYILMRTVRVINETKFRMVEWKCDI